MRQLAAQMTLAGGLLMLSTVATDCGGRTETDAAQNAAAGHTGGQPNNGGITNGTGGSLDASAAADAGICNGEFATDCCPRLKASASTQDMVNCVIPIVAPFGGGWGLFINCKWIPTNYINDAATPASDGWTVDNSQQPTRIILGASLCEQIKSQGVVPVNLVGICHCIK